MKKLLNQFLFFSFLFLGILFVFSLSYADENQLNPKIELEISKNIDSKMEIIESRIQRIEKEFDNLKQHNETHIKQRFDSYFEQIKHIFSLDKDSFDKMVSNLTWYAWACYFLLLVILAITGYKNISLKKLQDNVENRVKDIEKSFEQKIKRLEQYEKDLQNNVENRVKDIEKSFEQKIKRLEQYEEDLLKFTFFKDKKVLFIREHDQLKIENEVNELKKRGIKNIKTQIADNIQELNNNECDLMIYYYDGNDKTKAEAKLNKIIEILKKYDEEQVIPLIIYNHNTNPIKIKINYKNYLMANFPLTLIGHFNLAIRI